MWKVAKHNAGGSLTRNTVLILDNTPTTYAQNYGNAVRVPTWRLAADPEQRDTALVHIAAWIAYTSATQAALEEPSVRFLNKRLWWKASPFPQSIKTLCS
jgi:hypothetical protein